jgi:hypothetical protein
MAEQQVQLQIIQLPGITEAQDILNLLPRPAQMIMYLRLIAWIIRCKDTSKPCQPIQSDQELAMLVAAQDLVDAINEVRSAPTNN